MKKLASGVYLENSYHGVVLGAVVFSRGILLIDTPLLPEEGQDWILNLRQLGAKPERLLVNLDSHPDRVLGNHMIDSTIFAQREASETFKQKPAIFKNQNPETGAEWESCKGLTGIRWQGPNIVFSKQLKIQGADLAITIENHPGPEYCASWVIIPEKKVVFVGDVVVVKQPPFLANANLPLWIETLDILLNDFKDYKIVSGRSGLVNEKHIRNMRKMIVDLNKRMERLGKRKAKPEETKKMVAKILSNSESLLKHKILHSQRLQYGLFHYYARNYFPKKD